MTKIITCDLKDCETTTSPEGLDSAFSNWFWISSGGDWPTKHFCTFDHLTEWVNQEQT